jgi:hypothetical protein
MKEDSSMTGRNGKVALPIDQNPAPPDAGSQLGFAHPRAMCHAGNPYLLKSRHHGFLPIP